MNPFAARVVPLGRGVGASDRSSERSRRSFSACSALACTRASRRQVMLLLMRLSGGRGGAGVRWILPSNLVRSPGETTLTALFGEVVVRGRCNAT